MSEEGNLAKQDRTERKLQAQPVEAEPPVEKPALELVPEPEHYSVGSWNGMVQYRCRLCAFDTLEREAIDRHHRERHAPPPPPPAPSRPPLFDRFGNPLA